MWYSSSGSTSDGIDQVNMTFMYPVSKGDKITKRSGIGSGTLTFYPPK